MHRKDTHLKDHKVVAHHPVACVRRQERFAIRYRLVTTVRFQSGLDDRLFVRLARSVVSRKNNDRPLLETRFDLSQTSTEFQIAARRWTLPVAVDGAEMEFELHFL